MTAAPDELPSECEAERLTGKLRALYDAHRAVLDLITLGPRALPAVRRLLFRREPSGLYQPRVDAVFVLAALKAEAVLIDFLRHSLEVVITDPVERTGEDAVMNAAARGIKHRRDDVAFAVLTAIAEQRLLAGVIEALGATHRAEAIPYLMRGLSDDLTRPASETALQTLGTAASPALVEAALTPVPSSDEETVSSMRMRRSALATLREIGVTHEEWSRLSPLMRAADPRLAALACSLALASAQPAPVAEEVARTLVRLLRTADWLLTIEIEEWLAEHYELARRVAAGMLDGSASDQAEGDRVRRSLRRIAARLARANAAPRSIGY